MTHDIRLVLDIRYIDQTAVLYFSSGRDAHDVVID